MRQNLGANHNVQFVQLTMEEGSNPKKRRKREEKINLSQNPPYESAPDTLESEAKIVKMTQNSVFVQATSGQENSEEIQALVSSLQLCLPGHNIQIFVHLERILDKERILCVVSLNSDLSVSFFFQKKSTS